MIKIKPTINFLLHNADCWRLLNYSPGTSIYFQETQVEIYKLTALLE